MLSNNLYDDNDVFYDLTIAPKLAKKQRMKGFYVCLTCGEFIKTVARKEVPCPFCSRMCQKAMDITPVVEQTILLRWYHTNTYHPVKADCLHLS